MTYKVQRAMALSGIPLIVLTLVGYVLAGLLPVPPGANLTAAQIGEFYSSHTTLSRLGFLLAATGLGFLAPLVALITTQMKRIDGVPESLANLQQVAGTCVVIVSFVPEIIMNVAAFRPDRDPVVTQAINDIAWLVLVTPIVVFVLQEVPIAVAIFMDRSERPVFPRWVGYANLWIPLSFLPALLPYFAKSGPVSWQGILVFYLGLTTFGAWVIIMMWALLRALREQSLLEQSASTESAHA
jgi:hypothetical protein